MSTLNDPNIGRAIEAAMKNSGIDSKYQLAVRSRVSLTTTRLALMGVTTVQTLNRLSLVLGVSVDELRGRKPAPARAS